MSAEWIGVLIAFAVFFLGLLGNVISTVWWASKITASLDILTTAVSEIKTILARHEATYYTKEEAAKDFAHANQQINALWGKVDKLQGLNNDN